MQRNDNFQAVILNIPRIGPSRPSAGTAIIKSILNKEGVSNRLYDINIDFFNNFIEEYDSASFHELDLYFYIENSKLSDSTQKKYMQYIQNWIDRILSRDLKYIFLSIFTWQCQRFATDFLNLLKPQTKALIVIGGQGMIKSENTSFNECPYFAIDLKAQGLIDHFIQGEAEKALPELLKKNYSFQGIDSQQFAPRSEMDDVPVMDFSDHNILAYQSGYPTGQLPLESSRGCVRACNFCDWPLYAGGFRSKSGAQLFNEIINYYTKYNVNNFYFNDSLMNGNLKDFKLFNQLLVNYYKENNLPARTLKYSGMYIIRKPNQFSDEDFRQMAQAGADQILVGVESGSDRVRKEMRKGFNADDLDYTISMCSKHGIKMYFLMIVGYPSETRQDFEETLDLLRRYQHYVAVGTLVGINFGTTLTIGEGTPLYVNPENFGVKGVNGNRPHDIFWMHESNKELTYKERILRRIEAQELAHELGYTFWKGDDQLNFVKEKYEILLNENKHITS